MGDFNRGHIQWKLLESVGRDDQQFLLLIQGCFLTQHVLEPTRGGNVFDLLFSSQHELVDNIKICEPLGSSDHNQIHFSIKSTHRDCWSKIKLSIIWQGRLHLG